MITNPVIFISPEKELVEAYNLLDISAMDPNYWDSPVLNSVRQVIKKHYEIEQQFLCCYCNQRLLTSHGRVWDAEHVVAKSTHPQFLFEPKNLAVSCIDCNMAKGDSNVLVNRKIVRYPNVSSAFIIVHPHFDNFDDHILIFHGRFYQPKTRKGEETIKICRLMRYAYEYLEWDEGFHDDGLVVKLMGEYLNGSPGPESKAKLYEIAMVLAVQISRNLLN